MTDADSFKGDIEAVAGKGTAKQHGAGKFTAPERIARLLDEGSFVETGMHVSHRCSEFGLAEKSFPRDGVITGYGTIGLRRVFVACQDFRVNGGTLGEMHAKKIRDAQENALKTGVPFIFMADSGGARIQEGVDALGGFGDIFLSNVRASGVIPQIAIISGPCAGGAVYSPALMDFVFMTEGIAKMFITGPEVVRAVTGEEISAEALGGAAVHSSRSGVAHFVSANEDECFGAVRRLLEFIPGNNFEIESPCAFDAGLPYARSIEEIVPEDPEKPYDMRDVIRDIVDSREYLEVHADFALNISVGFGRIEGRRVGIVANNPRCFAGALDCDASDKAARFIRFCDAFGIPLVTLVDVPGYMPGSGEEGKGIIRHGAKMLYAYGEASVPKVTVIIRKAYGGAYIAMCSRHLGADAVFAYPDSEIAVMGAEGAVGIIYSSLFKGAADPVALRAEKVAEYRDRMMNPFLAAKRGFVDEIISPRETRVRIASSLAAFASKKVYKLEKKHGNIPL